MAKSANINTGVNSLLTIAKRVLTFNLVMVSLLFSLLLAMFGGCAVSTIAAHGFDAFAFVCVFFVVVLAFVGVMLAVDHIRDAARECK